MPLLTPLINLYLSFRSKVRSRQMKAERRRHRRWMTVQAPVPKDERSSIESFRRIVDRR